MSERIIACKKCEVMHTQNQLRLGKCLCCNEPFPDEELVSPMVKKIQDLEGNIKELKSWLEVIKSNIVTEKLLNAHVKNWHNRMSELEKRVYAEVEFTADFDERITSFEEMGIESRLLKLEEQSEELKAWIDTIKANMVCEEILNVNVDNLHERINGLETTINTVRALGSRSYHPKKPHKCPVCDGDGSIPHGVPAEMTKAHEGFVIKVSCNSCEGKGVIWG